MKNQKGLVPLLIPLIIAVVGVGGFAAYKVAEPQLSEVFKFNNPKDKGTGQHTQEQAKARSGQSCVPDTSFTEDQINTYADQYASKLEFGGFSIDGAKVELVNNGFGVTADIDEGKSIYAEFTLIDGGSDVLVQEVSSVGDINIPGFQLGLLKAGLRNIKAIITNYAPGPYVETFDHAEISNDVVTLYFDCPTE